VLSKENFNEPNVCLFGGPERTARDRGGAKNTGKRSERKKTVFTIRETGHRSKTVVLKSELRNNIPASCLAKAPSTSFGNHVVVERSKGTKGSSTNQGQGQHRDEKPVFDYIGKRDRDHNNQRIFTTALGPTKSKLQQGGERSEE